MLTVFLPLVASHSTVGQSPFLMSYRKYCCTTKPWSSSSAWSNGRRHGRLQSLRNAHWFDWPRKGGAKSSKTANQKHGSKLECVLMTGACLDVETALKPSYPWWSCTQICPNSFGDLWERIPPRQTDTKPQNECCIIWAFFSYIHIFFTN